MIYLLAYYIYYYYISINLNKLNLILTKWNIWKIKRFITFLLQKSRFADIYYTQQIYYTNNII